MEDNVFAAFSFSSVAGSSRKLKEEPHEYDADVKPQSVPTTSIGQSARTDKRRKLIVKKELFDPVAAGGRRVSEVVNVKAEVDIEDIKGHIATQKDLKNESNETKVSRFQTKAEGEQKGRSPPHWEKIVEEIRSMRIDKDAPVDLFGTHQLLDVSADKETQRFHALVAAMISSQTRDAVTGAAMQRLHAMPGGLTITQIASDSVEVDALAEILKPVGFYSKKAKYMKSIAETLSRPPHNGSVPCSLDELMKLPGVGPKVALLVLWVAFDMGEEGLIVDTNVRRVCSRLGWVPTNATPELTRKTLESWLPRALWADISFLFVGFGQQMCKPMAPKCENCTLKSLCPSAFSPSPKKPSRKVKPAMVHFEGEGKGET